MQDERFVADAASVDSKSSSTTEFADARQAGSLPSRAFDTPKQAVMIPRFTADVECVPRSVDVHRAGRQRLPEINGDVRKVVDGNQPVTYVFEPSFPQALSRPDPCRIAQIQQVRTSPRKRTRSYNPRRRPNRTGSAAAGELTELQAQKTLWSESCEQIPPRFAAGRRGRSPGL